MGAIWLDRLQQIFYVYLDCKSVVYVFIQIYYMRLQSKLWLAEQSEVSESVKEQLRVQVHDHRQLMISMGALFRELGTGAVVGYSSIICGDLIFGMRAWLPGHTRLLEIYDNDSFVLIYRNSKLSDERLNSIFDGYLNKMIALNAIKRRTILTNIQASIFSLEESNRIVWDLDEQQSHLNRLLEDKSSIWFENRQEKWKSKQTQFFVNFFTRAYTTGYLGSMLLVVIGVLYAESSNARYDENNEMNVLESMSLLEIYYIIFVTFERYLCPVVLLFADLRDRRMFLQLIRKQFNKLLGKLVKLSESKRKLRETQVFLGKLDHKHQQLKHKTDHLRMECNEESLEIYLRLRAFMDELGSTTKLASTIASQYSLFALLLLALALPSFSRSDPSQLLFATAVLVDMSSLINLAFLVCANFQSACSKTLECAWSLAAHSTLANAGQVQWFEVRRAIRLRELGHLRAKSLCQSRRFGRLSEGDYFRFNQMDNSLINMHTAQLWHRFVLDMPKMRDHFRCKVFGLIELNFSGMLRLNFWFVSVVLIFLTHGSNR